MVADKRADITTTLPGRKLILELKRDIHPELWTAPATQLDRFYTRDPDASGYGVYGVFWYGKHRKGALRKQKGKTAPKTALELETMLNELITAEQRSKLRAVVIDVSIPDGQRAGAAKRHRRRAKSPEPKTKQQKSAKAKKTIAKTSKIRSARGRSSKASRTSRKAEPSAGRFKSRRS